MTTSIVDLHLAISRVGSMQRVSSPTCNVPMSRQQIPTTSMETAVLFADFTRLRILGSAANSSPLAHPSFRPFDTHSRDA